MFFTISPKKLTLYLQNIYIFYRENIRLFGIIKNTIFLENHFKMKFSSKVRLGAVVGRARKAGG